MTRRPHLALRRAAGTALPRVARPEVLRRAWLPRPTPFGVPQGVPPGVRHFLPLASRYNFHSSCGSTESQGALAMARYMQVALLLGGLVLAVGLAGAQPGNPANRNTASRPAIGTQGMISTAH